MSGGEEIGYGKPPAASRFAPGRSGNPRGRPRGRRRQIPHDAVLGQMVTVREGARTRRITAAEAFLLKLTREGLAGDSHAAGSSLAAIEKARDRRPDENGVDTIVVSCVGMDISTILSELGLARKMHATNAERVCWKLQPWIVEAALGRLGHRRLTEDEQREVRRNTRTPEKVAWPDWWTVID